MALFLFNIRSGTKSSIDVKGSEFPDLQAAREDAERLTLKLVHEEIWQASDADINDIEICDYSGHQLELVTLKRVLKMPASPYRVPIRPLIKL